MSILKKYEYVLKSVTHIVGKKLSKLFIHHPVVQKKFIKEELKTIFGVPTVDPIEVKKYQKTINKIVELAIKNNHLSLRKLHRLCNLLLKKQFTGYYDCNLEVGIFIDTINDSLNIEYYILIKIYKQKYCLI